jgi:hypothetical protein
VGPGLNGAVTSLAFDSAGNLYAGGNFTKTGDAITTLNRIGKWDGVNWSNLASGIDDGTMVQAIAFDSADHVYIGGNFTKIGGVTVNGIAMWNGTSWSPMAGGFAGGSVGWGTVFALTFDSAGTLYAGGDFTLSGATSVKNIAQWNGSTWGPVGPGLNAAVECLDFDSSGVLYAGGRFTNTGDSSVPLNYLAKWDGGSWSQACGTGMNGEVWGLVFGAAGKLYLCGAFTSADGTTVNHVTCWNGSFFLGFGHGLSASVNALVADNAGNIYAGGTFTYAGGRPANRIAKWNGSYWSPLGSGPGIVNALTCDNAGNLYAGGDFGVAKWNGSAWSTLGAVKINAGSGIVRALLFDDTGKLYVGGEFTEIGGVLAKSVAVWGGTSWSEVGGGVSLWGAGYGRAYALAFANDKLYVSGMLDTAGAVPIAGVAQWNGSAWSDMAGGITYSGVEAWVYALACDSSDNLYAGGIFDEASGSAGFNNVAKWNGTAWSKLDTGVADWVNALACDSAGNLYVGTKAGALPGGAWRIGQWNGTTWSTFGAGVNGDVNAVILDPGGNLWVGGAFTTAGGKQSKYIAEYLNAGLQVQTPTFDLAAGTYTGTQSVTITCTTANSEIRYTTNGDDPTPTSTLYSGSISVDKNTTVKAIGVDTVDGLVDSRVASAAYTIHAIAPTFAPVAGTYTAAQSVTLTSATAGATIYYTTDGSTPTTGSTEYTGAINIATGTTLKAIAVKTGCENSTVSSASYILNYGTIATPTFSPAAGSYTAGQSVTISTTSAGATIYYTTDGSTPTTSSTQYLAPVNLTATTTLKALAVKLDWTDSAVASAPYTIQVATPTISPAGGTFGVAQAVALATSTPGATICYTTDGSTPSTTSTAYTAPVNVATTCTLKAIAIKTGCTDSGVASASFTITNTFPAITSGPVALPNPAAVGQSIAFSVAASDPDGDVLTYIWDFADGATSNQANASHTFSAAGSYTVSVSVSDGRGGVVSGSITVTVSAGGGGALPADSDSDGYSDEIEAALGSNPQNSADTPFALGSVVPGGELVVTKMTVKLVFTPGRNNMDGISIKGELPVPEGFRALDKKIILDVGGVVKTFTLDAKGASTPKGVDAFKLSFKATKGVVAKQTGKYSVKLAKSDFADALLDEGLTNGDVAATPVTIPVTLIVNGSSYQKPVTLSYKAKADKTGTAK